MNANKRAYTEEEQVQRLWDKEQIKDLVSRHAYMQSSDLRQQELDTLWVQEPEHRKTATLAGNWGFYVGMDEITRYYVTEHQQRRWEQLLPYTQADSSLAYTEENLGYGCWDTHTISSPMLHLAGDGQTARGMWYDCGQQTVGHPDGTDEEYFTFGLVAVDFVRESGGWKIWHMVLENDHSVAVGEDYSKLPVYRDPGTDPAQQEFGTPTLPILLHDSTYGWADHYPELPEPYESYSEENSYGLQGKRATYYTIGREYDIASVLARDDRWEDMLK